MTLAVVFFASSCERDDDNGNNNNNNSGVPTDAAGALSVIKLQTVEGTDTSTTSTAAAWFGSYTQTQHAGAITVNGEELADSLSGISLGVYQYTGYALDFSSTSNAVWVVPGSNTVTAFTHTDNTPFHTIGFDVPPSVSLNNSYTVNVTNTSSGYEAISIEITGAASQTKVRKYLQNGATSATFTSAELKSVAPYSGYPIAVNATIVGLTDATYNGKKYYFSKSYSLVKQTTGQ